MNEKISHIIANFITAYCVLERREEALVEVDEAIKGLLIEARLDELQMATARPDGVDAVTGEVTKGAFTPTADDIAEHIYGRLRELRGYDSTYTHNVGAK